jgi:glutamyl-tRNA synthetase
VLRFAPSSTQEMNIGNLRVAIFNYILSKQLNEKLLIKIEDTNSQKNSEDKEKEILELLNLFSIEYAQVVNQSGNLKYYQKLAMQLMNEKKAFACFCSDAKLEEIKEELEKEGKPFRYDGFCENLSDETVLNCNAPFTVRLKKPKEAVTFTDLLKGEFTFKPFEVDSFIILNHDKTPTYDYACAIDDMLYDISVVLREEKYLSNTPKQIHVRDSLNYNKKIEYIHLPGILNEIPVKMLIDEGFLPSAIANYLVLLGNKTPKEIFTLEEAVEWFDIKNISQNSVKFDIDKLKFINKKHLEKIDEMRLSKILGFADTDIGELGKLFLKEANTIKEIKSKIDSIFNKKTTCKGFEKEFTKIKSCMKEAPFYENFNELKEYVIEKTGLKGENFSIPFRYILTGENKGPELLEIYPLIKNYLGEITK